MGEGMFALANGVFVIHPTEREKLLSQFCSFFLEKHTKFIFIKYICLILNKSGVLGGKLKFEIYKHNI